MIYPKCFPPGASTSWGFAGLFREDLVFICTQRTDEKIHVSASFLFCFCSFGVWDCVVVCLLFLFFTLKEEPLRSPSHVLLMTNLRLREGQGLGQSHTVNVEALSCVNMAKLELHVLEFPSLHGSGLWVATREICVRFGRWKWSSSFVCTQGLCGFG